MAGSKRSTWIGGTALAGVALGAGAWFLAISPAFDAAAEVREQTSQTVQRNDLLEMQVTKLAADYAKLDQYKAELAALQVQIPTTARLADLTRQIAQIAESRGVTITALAPAPPQLVVPPVAAAPAAPATTDAGAGTDGTEPAAGGAGGEAAPVASPDVVVPAGLVAVPLSLTVVGTYDATVAFVGDLQGALPRLVLVTDLTGTSQEETEAGGGKPATARGDQEIVLSAFAYVLPDPAAGATAPEQPAAVPASVPGKNPLVPAAGE
ncbi:type 4a pilus biogenesis protein PilO [Cellulomonas sp. B6]|uniref:type 4a pilus biogenesis protein PilO n=1 Tax=Cellulomonas sp. B6 TaxID=1295626 RepID=UPI00073BAC85|nr:hypothetical protein [Cellulomonas sp. B6]KSW28994.1 hypothetical protein ATM99_10215 [Cellulomonas sp. B6]